MNNVQADILERGLALVKGHRSASILFTFGCDGQVKRTGFCYSICYCECGKSNQFFEQTDRCHADICCHHVTTPGEFLELANEMSPNVFIVVCEMELYKAKNPVKYLINLLISNQFLPNGILKIPLKENVTFQIKRGLLKPRKALCSSMSFL